MKFLYTRSFERDLRKLPAHIQELVYKQLGYFSADVHHPSLQVKQIQGTDRIWEMRITIAYRLTFQYESDQVCLLRRVARHDEALRKP